MTDHPLLERLRPESCLSDLALDRWLAGELAGQPAGEAVRAHLRACPACSDRLSALEHEPELLPGPGANPPPLTVTTPPRPAAERRAGSVSPVSARKRMFAITAGVAALAAGLVIVVNARHPAPLETGLRSKGDLQLDVVVRHSDGRTETVVPGDALSAGDVVRFVVSTPDPGFVFVIGLDAAGVATPYSPAVGVPAPLPAGRGQALPGTVILDDTLGAERFLLLHCNDATNVDVAVAAGRRALAAARGDPRRVMRLELPCRQVGIAVEKVRRP
jgi:hypothetical protein